MYLPLCLTSHLWSCAQKTTALHFLWNSLLEHAVQILFLLSLTRLYRFWHILDPAHLSVYDAAEELMVCFTFSKCRWVKSPHNRPRNGLSWHNPHQAASRFGSGIRMSVFAFGRHWPPPPPSLHPHRTPPCPTPTPPHPAPPPNTASYFSSGARFNRLMHLSFFVKSGAFYLP